MAQHESEIEKRDARRKRTYEARQMALEEQLNAQLEAICKLSALFWRGEAMDMKIKEVKVYRKKDGSGEVGIMVKGVNAEGAHVAFTQGADLVSALASAGNRLSQKVMKWHADQYQEREVPEDAV